MPPREGTPASGDEVQPSLERCPNCDRPLRFLVDQPEAYCPACGIFVEGLRPLGPTPSEEKPREGNELRLQTARLYLELEDVLEDDLEDDLEEDAGEPTDSPVAQAEVAEAAAPEAEPEPQVAEEELEALPAPVEIEETDELDVGLESLAPEEAVPEIRTEPSVAATAASVPELPARPKRWHRVLYYSGSVLVAFGGSGLALGSLLHDVFRVPFFGFAYDAFGQLNVSALTFGATFLLAGFAAMAVGARAGARRRHPVGG